MMLNALPKIDVLPPKKRKRLFNALPPKIDPDYIPGLVVYKEPLFDLPVEPEPEHEVATLTNCLGHRVPVYPSASQEVSFVETSVGLVVPCKGTHGSFVDKIGFGKDSIESPVVESVAEDWEPFVTVSGCEGSDYVKIDICRDLSSVSKSGGGNRGEINQFSRASRKRMLDTLCKLRVSAGLPQFATLTYPGEFPHDSKVWKNHLDLFGKRLAFSYPESSAIWKLEPQKRSAPHFHLIIYGVPFDRSFKEWLSRSWFEVVGSGDERHLRAGTNVQAARSLQGVKAYASKRYMGKELSPEELQDHAEKVAGWASPGRFWGVLNRDCLPVGKKFVERIEANFREVDEVKKYVDGNGECVKETVKRHCLAGESAAVVRAARKIYEKKTGRKVCCTASSITLYMSADLFRRFVTGCPHAVLNHGAVVVSRGFLNWSKGVIV